MRHEPGLGVHRTRLRRIVTAIGPAEADAVIIGEILFQQGVAQVTDDAAAHHGNQQFHAPIEIARHEIGAAHVNFIFTAIGELAGEAKPCDVVSVSQYLERNGKLEGAGGLAYLSSIARDTPTAANVRSYADIVRERSLLRQLIRAGTESTSQLA